MSLGLSIASRLAHLPIAAKRPAPARARLDTLIEPRETEFGTLHLLEHEAGRANPVDAASLQALALTETELDTSRPLYERYSSGLSGIPLADYYAPYAREAEFPPAMGLFAPLDRNVRRGGAQTRARR